MVALVFGCVLFIALVFVVWFFCSSFLNKLVLSDSSWSSVYECGFFSSVVNLNCFSVTYFFLLVVFVIFDLEVSLLLNMPMQGLLYNNFFYYYFFLFIVLFTYLIEVFTGYVRWFY
uniref:NADH-ubiquinone oxidoreductase chain 3 n=1 Tax=Taenia laticollis TaxID=1035110 RepID=N0DQT6_9CEST|nr:NADH dehydrogenase subunit 3 [Taenia laticollis]BAN15637.1 NADH dehydrogenase subunit 3 [Taenia laticollis]